MHDHDQIQNDSTNHISAPVPDGYNAPVRLNPDQNTVTPHGNGNWSEIPDSADGGDGNDRKKGNSTRSWRWWCLIVISIVGMVTMSMIAESTQPKLPQQFDQLGNPIPLDLDSLPNAAAKNDINIIMFEMISRYAVGVTDFVETMNTGSSGSSFYGKPAQDGVPSEIQLAFLNMLSDMTGPQPALQRRYAIMNLYIKPRTQEYPVELHALLNALPSNEQNVRLDTMLKELVLENADERSITADEAIYLHNKLGWFGDVLIAHHAPENDPIITDIKQAGQRAAVAVIGLVTLVILTALTGFVLFVIAIILLVNKKLKRGYQPPAAPRSGIVYLQALAVYLAFSFVWHGVMIFTGAQGILFGMIGIAIASILGVMWPMLRGVPWQTAKIDLGMHKGAGIIKEVFYGIVGYIACFPIFIVGVILTFILMLFVAAILELSGVDTSQQQPMSHPIIGEIANGGIGAKLFMFGLAAMFAPFFEEILFRGALFGYLRGKYNIIWSSLLMAFIFAIIHPQGIIAVPALMSLAVAFALLREWRGSLIAPMTAHALHNGTIVCMMILIFG